MSDQPNVVEFVSKRVERFNSFERLCKVMADDLKEMKYQVTQYEAKVQTYEKQILARKAEIAELDETIRRRKIEATGSLNNIAGDLQRREMELVKRLSELEVRERNVKARALEAEALVVKAENVINKSAPVAPRFAPVSIPNETLSAAAESSVAVAEPVVAESPAPEVKRGPGRPRKEVPSNS